MIEAAQRATISADDASGSGLFLNAAVLDFGDSSVDVDVLPRSNELAELRRQHRATHVLRAERDEILAVPGHVYGEANLFGAEAARVAWERGDEWLTALLAHLDRQRMLVGELLAEHLPSVVYTPPAATYLAWLIPWGKPVTLLAESAEQLAAAQRELVRVGIDRPAAAATGGPADWLRAGESLASFPRATFAELAGRDRDRTVVLDVRRSSERAEGWIEGSVHIPVHQVHRRIDEVPDGSVWVHCAGGMRAGVAASLLDAAGRDVVAVDDGFDAAAAAGLAIVTEEG